MLFNIVKLLGTWYQVALCVIACNTTHYYSLDRYNQLRLIVDNNSTSSYYMLRQVTGAKFVIGDTDSYRCTRPNYVVNSMWLDTNQYVALAITLFDQDIVLARNKTLSNVLRAQIDQYIHNKHEQHKI
jgi:hypothetical protein